MEQQNDTTQHLTPAPAAPCTDSPATATDVRRLPYTPPAVEVITVRTERGYAASGTATPWDPTPW